MRSETLRRKMPLQDANYQSSSTTTTTSKNKDLLVRHSIIAGSVSGMASTVALYPLDVLRTKLQTSGLAHVTAGSAATAAATTSVTTAAPPRSLVTLGPWQLFRHTLQHGGGVRALYTGMALPVAAQAVYKGTVFTVNNVTQTFLLDFRTLENHKLGNVQPGQLTFLDRFWCGCLGGAVNAYLFVTPVEFVRNQLIAQQTQVSSAAAAAAAAANSIWTPSALATSSSAPPATTSSSWGVIRSSVLHHGVSSLWRGAAWSVARDGWGCGWFFVTMFYAPHYIAPVLQAVTSNPHSSDPRTASSFAPTSFPVTVVAGGMAGLAYWVTSLPLDTVKTWIQSASLGDRAVSASESIRLIWQQHGTAGVVQQLFRGWQVAYGRGIPSAAITFTVYTAVFDRLQQASKSAPSV